MSRYDEVMRQRAMNAHNAHGSGVQDFSGPLAPGVGRDAIDASVKKDAADLQTNSAQNLESSNFQEAGEKMGAQAATQSAQQGNLLGTAGGAMMMSGNPYLMAAGLGLQVVSSGEQNKRAEEEQQRLAYNEKIKQRQEAMSNIAKMGIQ